MLMFSVTENVKKGQQNNTLAQLQIAICNSDSYSASGIAVKWTMGCSATDMNDKWFLRCVGSMLCHCPGKVDDYTDMFLMQLSAFLNNKNGKWYHYINSVQLISSVIRLAFVIFIILIQDSAKLMFMFNI